ncbi:thymidine kinase [Candidatus Saccharibacteria bacterium]|nr:thymidine kinase [Candidatus Saccharibacteria bacterium]
MEGHLTVVAGPMFAGKTSELSRLVTNLRRYGNLNPLVVYPSRDTRPSRSGLIAPHGSDSSEGILAEVVTNATEILDLVERFSSRRVLVIDEVMLFPLEEKEGPNLIQVVNQLLRKGWRVVVAGLDMDFRGQPFGVVPGLMALAEATGGKIYNLTAVCEVCGATATMTQRMVNGQPAHYDDGSW